MNRTKRPIVPNGGDEFTDEEFATATDRVVRARETALANTKFAQVVEEKRLGLQSTVSHPGCIAQSTGPDADAVD